ncbi:MAG: hypothetical protein ACP5OG_04030 [Candidatus Nanoarchaeia archaeon]
MKKSKLESLNEVMMGLSVGIAFKIGIMFVLDNHNDKLEKFPTYNNKQQILEDINEEKTLLGLEDKQISYEITEKIPTARWDKTGKDQYKITFNPKYFKKSALQHEMYHIKNYAFWKHFTGPIQEWNATSYALERNSEEMN